MWVYNSSFCRVVRGLKGYFYLNIYSINDYIFTIKLRSLWGFYQLNFEWIVGEHLKCLCFCKQNPLVWLLLLSVFLYFLLYFLIVLLRYFCLPDKRIIEKSVVKRWTMAEPSSVKIFQALSKQMSTRMPKNLLPDFVLKRN